GHPVRVAEYPITADPIARFEAVEIHIRLEECFRRSNARRSGADDTSALALHGESLSASAVRDHEAGTSVRTRFAIPDGRRRGGRCTQRARNGADFSWVRSRLTRWSRA